MARSVVDKGSDASSSARPAEEAAGGKIPVPAGGEDVDQDHEEDNEEDANGQAEAEDEEKALEEVEWDEVFACPFDVRFTQEKIHPFFYRRGPIVNVLPKIRAVLIAANAASGNPEDEDVVELMPPFSAIRCLHKGEELWSLDNRRLYALQMAAMDQWPSRCRIRILTTERLPRHKFKSQYRKFNTLCEGRGIEVCARYQSFDHWNWFDRAVDAERIGFSDRVGTIMSGFQIVPVMAALLFRTGLTGFTSRVPLILGIILSFAVDFIRQKVPALERRVCALHVRALRNGEAHQISSCWRRLRQSQRDYPDQEINFSSAPQLAFQMALALVLLLPYVLGVGNGRVRSSLISCWLGVGCMLAMQLVIMLRASGGGIDGPPNGEAAVLTPKHRD